MQSYLIMVQDFHFWEKELYFLVTEIDKPKDKPYFLLMEHLPISRSIEGGGVGIYAPPLWTSPVVKFFMDWDGFG